MYNISKKYFPGFLFLTKVMILAFALHLISSKIQENEGLIWVWENPPLKSFALLGALGLVLLMSTANWFLEIFKWKYLVGQMEKISFFMAARQTLVALTSSLITPNRIGEYGTKVLYFPKAQRWRIILFNFVSNFYQMGATLVFGLSAFWLVDLPSTWGPQAEKLKGIAWIAATLLLGLTLLLKLWKEAYKKLVEQLRSLGKGVQLKVFGLSLLRYLIFSHQFYLILFVLGAEPIYAETMGLIFLTYLISSLIPGFVLFDWLVKGSVALTLFAQFGVDARIVLATTGLMWLLNFALPSTIGGLLLLREKSFRFFALNAAKK